MRAGLLALLGLLCLPATACADPAPSSAAPAREQPGAAFRSVVVFGDSLVDAGNVFASTGGRYAAAREGYVAGRFSNGYTFADRIALGVEGRVTRPSRSGGKNFAWGGARALADRDGIPDALEQVEAYRAASGGRADPNALFLLTFGGNDLRRPAGSEEAVARSYAEAVRRLFAMGAGTILVTGAPIPSAAGAALQRRLDVAFDAIPLKPGQRLLRYDFVPLWRTILEDAPRLGFRPWTPEAAARAAMPRARGTTGDDCRGDGAQASGCAGYVLFDRVHPTAAAHALIARDMAARLGIPVADPPEPKR